MPETKPQFIAVTNLTSSKITIRTGDSVFANENGLIMYYNVSATEVATGFTKYYTAHIMENTCIGQRSNCSGNSTCHFVTRASLMAASREKLETVHACVGNYSEMPKSALIISYTITNLRYWTNYSIQSALCNSKGCGGFRDSVLAKTDEHAPTCAPNATSIYNTSSTSLSIEWIRTPIACTHGVITYFNVYFSPETELRGNECFNDTSCWPLHSPDSNQTKYYLTNVTEQHASFSRLKKYRRYCVLLQTVNIKGMGPVSRSYCTYTGEDGMSIFTLFVREPYILKCENGSCLNGTAQHNIKIWATIL